MYSDSSSKYRNYEIVIVIVFLSRISLFKASFNMSLSDVKVRVGAG